ncbi:squalene synthase HpnC [Rhodopirellula europaea]|uniref:Squalene/phytoene synthase n=1 Tax=Rhodopirellula europaea 6C TaxID=1263867 RepID=M2B0B8_9BACT|nr:squalene synthase HpnC [Rhodopirellula europaea]EMB15233.1 squalene/phytoene synthase [Rhodopirellula europaea 6C]
MGLSDGNRTFIIHGEDGRGCFRDGLADSRAECRAIAKASRENFLVATCLLPRAIRQPFYDLYAFCRTADDLADESGTPEKAVFALAEYRRAVAAMYSDERQDGQIAGIFVALADTVRRYSIPRQLLDDLLDAFVQDQSIVRYRDEEQLLDYCRRSANPVGRMILRLADADSDENVLLSDEICTALQLVNFWQDVSRDRLIGRVYIPESIMHRFGFEDETIRRGLDSGKTTPEEVRVAIKFLCKRTQERFHRGMPLVDQVPGWLSADLKLFVEGGLATVDAIEAIDFDVLRVRPVVRRSTQLRLLGRAMWQRCWSGRVGGGTS